MSALLGTIYVGVLSTEKKVARWHHTSAILIVAMNFSLTVKWIVINLEEGNENAD